MKKLLTQKLIESLQATGKRYVVTDTKVHGFHVRVGATGHKAYYLAYRFQGKRRCYRIGNSDGMNCGFARDQASKALAKVMNGTDVSHERQQARKDKALSKGRTLGEYLTTDYYPVVLETQKSGLATLKRIKSTWGSLLDKDMASITQLDVEKLRADRYRQGKSMHTINRDVTALRGCLTHAHGQGVIPKHPLADLKKLPAPKDTRVRYLSIEEEDRLLKALQDSPKYFWAMVKTALHTGMRRRELFVLRWRDVDFRENAIHVVGKTTKTGHPRHIPMSRTLQRALFVWQRISPYETDPDCLVFPSPATGELLTNVKRQWRLLMRRAGIKDFRFHDMRHDFCSKLVMKGEDVNKVRELAGHKDLNTTQRYAHLSQDSLQDAVNKLDR